MEKINYRQFHLRLPEELVAKIEKERLLKHELNRASVIRRILTDYFLKQKD